MIYDVSALSHLIVVDSIKKEIFNCRRVNGGYIAGNNLSRLSS